MIRPEQPTDRAAVRTVHCAAFPASAEADLVDALRNNGKLLVSLVALDGAQLVGHIAFSPVTIEDGAAIGYGLAPVAVLPSHQNRGIGSELIRAGLDSCRTAGIGYVVVLGSPTYYQRFGFAPAAQLGLDNEYGAGDEFMVLGFEPNCLSGTTGLVQYGEEFSVFS